jgi:3-hydroxyacyl-[acyl-carrier protein] dehydratase/trans-2-decenoyl-[acyl-carrier protein] isomerase
MRYHARRRPILTLIKLIQIKSAAPFPVSHIPMNATPVIARDGTSYDREHLVACGEGRLFGIDAARLPTHQMLMLDRITHVSMRGGAHGRGELRAELDVRPDLWFFSCHFPGDPVMPGCLGLDALWQLLGFFLAWSGHRGRGRALGVDAVRFSGQVLPTSRLVTYRIDVRRVMERRMVFGIADGELVVDGRRIYSATGLRVGLFQSTDSF